MSGNILGLALVAVGIFLIVIARRGTGTQVAHAILPGASQAQSPTASGG